MDSVESHLTSVAGKREIPEISLTKKDFKLREDVIFLNHGSYGACPRAIL